MSIQVSIPYFLQYLIDGMEVAEVNGDTAGQCLDHLVKQLPDIKKELFNEHHKLLNYIDIYVNGKSTYPEELAQPVKDGDELSIVFIIAGG